MATPGSASPANSSKARCCIGASELSNMQGRLNCTDNTGEWAEMDDQGVEAEQCESLIGSPTPTLPQWMQSALGMSAKDAVCLDGGLATELENRGCSFNTQLWSAQLLLDNPSAVYDSHRTYLKAGARIITAASYQATLQGLSAQGLDAARARNVLLDAVSIAGKARDDMSRNTGHAALVAASVGPYGAYLSDGSEYQGNYGLDAESLVDFHQERIELLDASGADILACETIPDYNEALALSRILKDVSTPCWASLTCNDGNYLRDGTPIENAAALFGKTQSVFAVGVNCTPPEHITPLIRKLRVAVPDKTVIVYPNSGETYAHGVWSGKHARNRWQQDCQEWIDCGARIIGGCCRIGPIEIKQLTSVIDRANKSIRE